MPDRPLVTNASNPAQVEKARKRAEYNEKLKREDLQKLLTQPEFRRYVWDILARCGVNESVFTTSAAIYYNSGRQDVGHSVLADIIEAKPEAYIHMMEERKHAT